MTIGRPKKKPRDLRCARVVVLVTRDERAELEDACEREGVSVSDYVRARIRVPYAGGIDRRA